jgi:peptidoglycan/LPS O-acetylase OafA/YrhL
MLALVSLWVAIDGRSGPDYGEALGAALLYVSNWQLVFQHISYFQHFAQPSPLGHLWSLAIEEQFYVFWPLLLLLAVRLIPERSRLVRPRLAALTLVVAAVSIADMAIRFRPSLSTSPVYYGTDTRMFELLIGAALAMVWPSRQLRANIAVGARRLCDAAGIAGLVTIGLLVALTDQYSTFIYHGGFVILSVATAVVVAAVVHPAGRLGDALGVAPLRWIGVRSYGIYLWHLPIFVLTTPPRDHGIDLTRATLQVAATLVVAALSWRWIEEPIRYWRTGRARPRPEGLSYRIPGRRRYNLRFLPEIAAVIVLAAIVATLTAASNGGSSSAASPPPAVVAKPLSAPLSTRSSCRAVVDIGDSTSEGLISKSYLPNAHQRIRARFDQVGATVQHYEISGARSIIETYDGKPNAVEDAQQWKSHGYKGCWVLALGTNDVANIYVGSSVNDVARIQRLMTVIGNRPVLWVDTKSLLESGPWSEHNMEAWNAALRQMCHLYPTMRVFAWSTVARDSWFIDDGLHYTTPGYAERALLIAAALAKAFPAKGQSPPGCVVT